MERSLAGGCARQPAQPVAADIPDHSTGIYLIDISAEELACDELILAKQ